MELGAVISWLYQRGYSSRENTSTLAWDRAHRDIVENTE
jgi:hypothetical protein